MFKYLRQHQSWILAVGVTVLMFVFLIEIPVSNWVRGDAESQPVGTIKGEKIRLGEQRAADSEVRLLRSINPILVGGRESSDTALQWLLLVREAKSLGLDVSRDEVDQLRQLLLGEEEGQTRALQKLGVSVFTFNEALRHWGMVQQVQELVTGVGHLPLAERLAMYGQAMQFAQMGYMPGAMMVLESARGKPRLSEPLLTHFVQEQQASVQIAAVAIPAERYLGQVKSVSDQEVQALFEKYRDKVADQSGDDDSASLGYKTPDRVKLEYLAIPYERLRGKIEIDEADVLTYFDEHKAEFAPRPEPGATQPATPPADATSPDDQARAQIIDRLKEQRASDLATRILKFVQAALSEQTRRLKNDGGYLVIPSDFKPVSLESVAQLAQKEFGLLPDVRREEGRWLTALDLPAVPGLGRSAANGRPTEPFAEYVMSAKELAPKSDNPLLALRLQVGVPSVPMVGLDGSRYLFRLIAAEPARAPASLDEVRERVTADARRLAAYELLKKELPRWNTRAQSEKLDSIAKEVGRPVMTPPAFRRRELNAGRQAPQIPGLGRDAKFTDAVFTLAQEAFARGPIETLPPAQRSQAIASDANACVVLVRVDSLKSITRRDFDRAASSPLLAGSIQQALMPLEKDEDPLALPAIKKRLGFVSARESKEEAAATQPTKM